MAAPQWQINHISGAKGMCACRIPKAGPSRSSQCFSSSSFGGQQQHQGGWLQRAAAAAAVVRPSLPYEQPGSGYSENEHQQWLPRNPAAVEQQQLHELVRREQQQAAHHQHRRHRGEPLLEEELLQAQQQQQQHRLPQQWREHQHPQQSQQHVAAGRSRSSNSWQLLASQLELGSSSVTLTQLVDCLLQLAQPGMWPSGGNSQGHYISFMMRLLMMLQQQLQAATPQQQQQQQQGQPSVALQQVCKMLWALAKLKLQPDWEQLQQQQQQQQQQQGHTRGYVPYSQHQLQQTQLQQRAADVIHSASLLLQQHLQCGHAQLQQQGYHSLPPALLSQGIWALAKLQYPAGAGFLQLYLAVTQPVLSRCSCQNLSNLAWGLCQLQCRPGQQWQAAFFDAVAAGMDGSSSSRGLNGQAAASVLLHAAELQVEAPEGWLQYMLSCIISPSSHNQQQWQLSQQQQQRQREGSEASLLQQMDARCLASLLGALAKFGHVPTQDAFLQLQLAVMQQLHSCNGLDTAQLLWAFATIAAAAPAVQLDDSSSGVSSASGGGRQGGTAGAQLLLLLLPGLLQGLTRRLADTVAHTAPQQVVLGIWGTAKLHQLTRPASWPQQQQRQQQQQEQQHWHLCRDVVVHCLSYFQSAGVLAQLNGHSMALLAWGLALAGAAAPAHFNASQQQQQQQAGTIITSSSSQQRPSSRSRSRYVGLNVPSEFLRQLLACSRLTLSAAAPHSQALLLSALVHMKVKPSWQWMLGFWEASEPLLCRCSAQDLSMLAEGLVRLRVKPLGSWLTAFLQATQGLLQKASGVMDIAQQFPQGSAVEATAAARAAAAAAVVSPNVLTVVLGAVADPCWGLVPAQHQGSVDSSDSDPDSSSSSNALPVAWTAAVQRHLLLLMPELQLGEIALLLRAAGQLGWCAPSTSAHSSSSSSSETLGATAVQGLLHAAVSSSSSQVLPPPQQPLSTVAEDKSTWGAAAAGQAVGLLQCMSAALQLPLGCAEVQWWTEVLVRLQHSMCLQQQQQQQGQNGPDSGVHQGGHCKQVVQQDAAASLVLSHFSHRQLHAGLHTLQQVLQAPVLAAGTQDHVLCCMRSLADAAGLRAADMDVQELLLFLLLSRDCLQLLDSTAAVLRPSRQRSCSKEGSSDSRDGSQHWAACQAALQQLLQAVLAALLRALPSAALQDFAVGVHTLSKCGYMMHEPQAAAGGGAARSVATARAAQGAAAGCMGGDLVAAVLPVLQQHLLQLERVMLQEQQYLVKLQQEQQARAQPGTSSVSPAADVSVSACSIAAQEAAPHLVRVLAAFAHSNYRPPAHILRQMLRVVQAGMPALTPRQLSVLAAAASVLQLGFLAGPGLSLQLWNALGAVLKPPEQLQLELNHLHMQQLQLQQQQQQVLHQQRGLGLSRLGFSPQACTAAAAVAVSTPLVQPVHLNAAGHSSRQSARHQGGSTLLARPHLLATRTVAAVNSSNGTSLLSHGSSRVGSLQVVSQTNSSLAAQQAGRSSGGTNTLRSQLSSYVANSSSSSSSVATLRTVSSSRLGMGRSAGSGLKSMNGMSYSVAVLLAVKALHTLCSSHEQCRSNSSNNRAINQGQDCAAVAAKAKLGSTQYAAACSRSCRAAVGKQMSRQLAAAAFKAAATVVQHALLPCTQPHLSSLTPQRQQQVLEQKQQRVAVIVPVLRLLKPLACLMTLDDLKNFTMRVGPLLQLLEGRQKVRSWKALHAVLKAYRSGRQLRQVLLQRHKQRTLLLWRRQQQQQQQQQGSQRRRQQQQHLAAAATVDGKAASRMPEAAPTAGTASRTALFQQTQQQGQQHQAHLMPRPAATARAASMQAGPTPLADGTGSQGIDADAAPALAVGADAGLAAGAADDAGAGVASGPPHAAAVSTGHGHVSMPIAATAAAAVGIAAEWPDTSTEPCADGVTAAGRLVAAGGGHQPATLLQEAPGCTAEMSALQQQQQRGQQSQQAQPEDQRRRRQQQQQWLFDERQLMALGVGRKHTAKQQAQAVVPC